MKYIITRNDSSLRGGIALTPAKTVGNKVLIIRALKSSHITQHFATEQDDARIVDHNLFADGIRKKRGDVYKSIRYIRAVARYFGGEWILSTSDILKKRSGAKVVQILKKHGISIDHEERSGRPPIRLIGKNVRGSVVRVDGMINSKMLEVKFIFHSTISAAVVDNLKNAVLGSNYIKMTMRALQRLGVNTDWNIDEVLIEHEIIDGSELVLESDWSMVSYMYAMVALSRRASLQVNGVNSDSFQPELAVKDIFTALGVETKLTDGGIILGSSGHFEREFSHGFIHYPELIPAVIMTCVCKKIPFTITGSDSLRKREVDRIKALQTELLKVGASIVSENSEKGEVLTFDGTSKIGKTKEVEFDAYNDQRISLALMLVAMRGVKVTLQNPSLANKSYINFWEDIKPLGFSVSKE